MYLTFYWKKRPNGLNKALQKQVLNKEFLKAFQEQLVIDNFSGRPLHNADILADAAGQHSGTCFAGLKVVKAVRKVQDALPGNGQFYESAYWSIKDTIETMKLERETAERGPRPELETGNSPGTCGFCL